MKIHKTSIIEDGAKLGINVTIGPYSHIGKNVILGDNVVIQGYCEIGYFCYHSSESQVSVQYMCIHVQCMLSGLPTKMASYRRKS